MNTSDGSSAGTNVRLRQPPGDVSLQVSLAEPGSSTGWHVAAAPRTRSSLQLPRITRTGCRGTTGAAEQDTGLTMSVGHRGLIFGLIRLRSSTFIGVRINAAMQVANVNGIQ
jgi:hypothetical protein